MIISKTPYRISFFGGGSDYPDWYLKNGGRVFSTSINKYIYILIKDLPKFSKHKYRIAYSKVETTNSINKIKHNAIREILRLKKIKNCEINCIGDLPARTGIGSSSAFSVGLINATTNFNSKKISTKDMYLEAMKIEREILKENVGSQDQIATACGGLNSIIFNKNGIIKVKNIKNFNSRKIKFNKKLLLFYSGKQRKSSLIATDHINSIKKSKIDMGYFSNLAFEAEKIFCSKKNLNIIGEMLDESWKMKKKISNRVSTNEIDEYYDVAKKAGAIGGKVLGAGGGGFLLIFTDERNKNNIIDKLSFLKKVDFSFDNQGSKIFKLK